jgi:uncharacterized protein with HEPN domain
VENLGVIPANFPAMSFGDPMLRLSKKRDEIYNFFHSNDACQKFFFSMDDRYAAYYTSMYLLQDTVESLHAHRAKSFSADPMEAYTEFWGIMQALIIQQDSICELYEAITSKQIDTTSMVSWRSLRELRNMCAGHPAKKDRPKSMPVTRTFMARGFGDYSAIRYEKWQSDGSRSFPTVNLGELIDSYAAEAEALLGQILQSMKHQW